MNTKQFPFNLETIQKIEATTPTPFHVYDEAGIVDNARRLNAAFSWNPGFKNYFAVKATPNPALLSLLKTQIIGSIFDFFEGLEHVRPGEV